MLREMAEAIEALSATTPILLVLEDLHWSDYSTLDLLAMLARRQESARLLVVGSYRSVDIIVAGHPLRPLIQELRVRRQCEDIALAFLREPHVAAYLAQRFGGHAFPPELARAVHQRTDGNPLFMVRVVDELVALRVLEPEDDRWRLRGPVEEIARAVPESLVAVTVGELHAVVTPVGVGVGVGATVELHAGELVETGVDTPVGVGVAMFCVGVLGGAAGHPLNAAATAVTMQSTVTLPARLQSKRGHWSSGSVPRAMFTPFTSSATVTAPLLSQSPTQVGATLPTARVGMETDAKPALSTTARSAWAAWRHARTNER
jgi:hypothetical protein